MINFKTLKDLRDGYSYCRTLEEYQSVNRVHCEIESLLNTLLEHSTDYLTRERIKLHLKNLKYIETLARSVKFKMANSILRNKYKVRFRHAKTIKEIE